MYSDSDCEQNMRTIPTPQSCKGRLLLTLCLAVVLFSAGCIQDQTIPVSEADTDRMNATFAAVYASFGHSLDAIGEDVAGTAEDQSGRLSADPFLKLSVKSYIRSIRGRSGPFGTTGTARCLPGILRTEMILPIYEMPQSPNRHFRMRDI